MGFFKVGCAILFLMVEVVAANVVLMGNNVTLSFDDVEANFAPTVKGSGVCGVLYVAEPLDACQQLTNKVGESRASAFVLIIRGGCTFDDKIINAQNAGFKAAIVYDNEDGGGLVSMAGSSSGVHIYAVFVSKVSGEILKKHAGRTDVQVWIIPTFENSAWSIMAISFISLLAMSAVLATCFFVRRHRIRRERPTASEVREFHGMSSRLVKAMPTLIFTSVLEDNCTSRTCAICLEDYNVGEKLRILPCRHKFHAVCVDLWLTSWRTFCPVCKRDARAGIANPPASESTPLLSSNAPSYLSSFHSSAASSPPIQIVRPPVSQSIPQTRPPLSQSASRTYYSVSSNPCTPNHSPAIHISRSSADIRTLSARRARALHLASPHSLGLPLSSPTNPRHASPYAPRSSNASSSYLVGSSICIPRSSNASPSYLAGSSSRMSYLQHCGESEASLSAMTSAQSLPGC